MAAVWKCGPQEQTAAFVLLAIADNSDDFGFACPSHKLLAMKARCDERTVIRQVAKLEETGWLGVIRKCINGKANAYFVNLAKIGVTPSLDAFQSPLHAALRKRHGDTLSRIFLRQMSGDTSKLSGDNPQPLQVTNAGAQVTKPTVSSDTRSHMNSKESSGKNRKESPKNVETSPLPPTGGVNPDLDVRWRKFQLRLKQELCEIPAGVSEARFSELRPGQNDYDTCFRDWWLIRVSRVGSSLFMSTASDDVAATRAGLEKYQSRVKKTFRECFNLDLEDALTVNFFVSSPSETTEWKGSRGESPEHAAGAGP